MRLLIFSLLFFLVGTSSTLGRDLTEGIQFGGLQRTYRVHLPKKFDGRRKWPVVIVFHGFANDSLSMEELTGFDAIADREKFLVVYPDGVSRHWSFGESRDAVDDVGFTLALLARMRAKFFADPRRTYAVGISNGGFLVLTLACQHPEQFAAVATVAATFSQQQAKTCKPSRPVPIALIHGELDRLIPFGGGLTADGLSLLSVPDTVKRWAVLNNCENQPYVEQLPRRVQDGTAVQQTRFLKCRGATQVHFYEIGGGGHTWPGSTKNLPILAVGKASQNIKASEVLWQFFRSFP
ncbi:MAG: prolyl oligopeptidase family serine peptidase [Anaerolineae bacterium]|nr:prolyl oligopeptidase family serine peptidase [Gloeobacterales cyanobacterium ES-bin-313]